jgi:hypothetical protein
MSNRFIISELILNWNRSQGLIHIADDDDDDVNILRDKLKYYIFINSMKRNSGQNLMMPTFL